MISFDESAWRKIMPSTEEFCEEIEIASMGDMERRFLRVPKAALYKPGPWKKPKLVNGWEHVPEDPLMFRLAYDDTAMPRLEWRGGATASSPFVATKPLFRLDERYSQFFGASWDAGVTQATIDGKGWLYIQGRP